MTKYLRSGWVLALVLTVSRANGADPSPSLQAAIADAERLERLGRWSASGDAYLRALRLQPDTPQAEKIAMKAIKMHSNFHDLGCAFKKAGNEPVPIEGQLAKVFAAYETYLKLFPSSKMAATVRYRKASTLEECNHFREAADLYRQVYELNPDLELAKYAREAYRRVHQSELKPSDERNSRGERRKVHVE